MVVIKSAKFGDEYDTTDVSKSLADKVKDGAIDIYVDSGIIPFVDKASGVNRTRLTDDEAREIKDTVAEMCGPTDQVCIEIKKQELAEAKLKQKEATKTTSTAQVIKGRKLTVTYTDDSGRTRTAIIPEGQQFQVGDLGKLKPTPEPVDTTPSAASQVFSSVWGVLGTTVLVFLYAASIIVTWMTFVKYGSKLVAGGMVAVAVFIPYSGFGLSFFGPFLAEYFRVDKLSRLKATVPEEFAAIAKANPLLLPTGPASGNILSGRK
jgi:hypothetical protein